MLLGALLSPTVAHAATGVVSVNSGTLVTATKTQTTVSIPINIAGSDSLNGFDIQVLATTSFLDGASVSLSGSILGTHGTPAVVQECIDGVLVAGSTCSATDGLGVVHLAATAPFGTALVTGSGLLFTINYKITGLTAGTPVTFQKGCTSTSVSGDCVTIANGSATAVSETDQGTTFANLVDFTVATAHPAYSTPPSTPIGIVINYASEGGYSDVINEAVAASPAGPTCTFASATNSVDLSFATSGSDTLTCSGPAGSYSVSITGTGSGFCSCGVISHTISVPLAITPADFSVSLSPSSVTVSRGNTGQSTINLAGISGFSGTVSFTASSSQSGITGSAPMATLTNDGSGYSTATSTLTISVASTVPTGSYVLTVTGTSGTSHNAALTVLVPGLDFSIFAVPNSVAALRGGTVATILNINSLGNLAGTASFTSTVQPVAGKIDNGCLGTCSTSNITPSFAPATATLTAGGNLQIQFFAATIGGDAAIASNTATATGSYTATITATISGVTHTVTVFFKVEDFTIGPSFCTGNNFVQTSPDSLSAFIFTNTTLTGGDIAGQLIGTPCSSLTITDQPNPLLPYLSIFSSPSQVLWVQANAFGGYSTDGFDGLPSVSAVNFALPSKGISVPQLAPVFGPNEPHKVCMVPTFWPNGTQISYSYLAANGPLILPSSGLFPFLGIIDPNDFAGLSNWGCRFDNAVYPNDQGNSLLNAFENGFGKGTGNFGLCFPNFDPTTPCDYQNINNPDYWGVTAMSLVGTLAGDYTFLQCANNGAVQHCQRYGLTVLAAPVLHQLVVKKAISFAASGGSIAFKVGITNPSLTHTVFAQVTVTGIGSFGDTFSATSGVIAIAPNANVNDIALSAPLSASEIGETFTFSVSIIVGTDPNNLDGTSTEQSVQQTIHITA